VKAKSFADREIRYTLKAQGQGAAGTFNIGPTSGIVKLAKELDFEDLRQPHIYSLIVTATEDSGGFSTSVEVSEFMFLNFCPVSGRNDNSCWKIWHIEDPRAIFALLVELVGYPSLFFPLGIESWRITRMSFASIAFASPFGIYRLAPFSVDDPSVRRER